MATLELNPNEKDRLANFRLMCEIFNKRLVYPHDYLSYTYEVSETGVGTCVFVICDQLGSKDNITDYDSW